MAADIDANTLALAGPSRASHACSPPDDGSPCARFKEGIRHNLLIHQNQRPIHERRGVIVSQYRLCDLSARLVTSSQVLPFSY